MSFCNQYSQQIEVKTLNSNSDKQQILLKNKQTNQIKWKMMHSNLFSSTERDFSVWLRGYLNEFKLNNWADNIGEIQRPSSNIY